MKAIRIKYIKTIIFFAGILSQLAAFGQDANSLIRQFESYSSQHLQEKVFVHTDKSFYLTGEIVWFKVYVTDAVLNKPSEISKICYVEIINKDLKSVLQGKIEINSGSGNGSFTLPGFLATGNYIIRAYTNWMKNIDADYFFEKNISIVNILKKSARLVNDSSNVNVQFFPEGGQMVNGLQTTVAFHFTDKNGTGVPAIGLLLNQANDTILQFSPLRFGIGRFSFTPQKNDQYKAVIIFGKGKMITKQLPPAYNEGYVMHVSDADTDHVKVAVTSNLASGNVAYLFVHTRNRFKAMVQQPLKNGVAEFIIDKKTLADGITHFTVFNSSRQPVCERLYFKRPENKLDIAVSMEQNAYSERTKVDLGLNTSQQQTAVADADMSISAFLIDSLQPINELGILTYLLLTSDLTGRIESPDWYISNNGVEEDGAIDDLMLTHGWRRFKWEEILQDQKPYFKYLPEMEGQIVTGKLFDKTTALPAKNITAYLTVPGQYYRFTSSVSNDMGELMFNIKKFYGNNEIIAQTNNRADSNYRFDFVNPFADRFSNNNFPPLILSQQWKDQLESRNINSQVENVYLKEAKQRFDVRGDADTLLFFGKPDNTYYLDDYTRFTTMEEVMREFVVEVRVRKPSDYNFRVKIPNSVEYFDNPLVLVDGVPVFNVNKIIEMDPLKIKKIDIVTHKYYSGSLISDGVISYSSYDGGLGGTVLDPNGLIVEYDGLQREREFYSPSYNTPEKLDSRIPDARNVLYWSPTVKTDEKGHQNISFYTSDLPGKYAVIVQGITPGGLAGSTIVTFDVQPK